MSGGGGGGDKTEKPTPERRKKARSEGQIPRTPDLAAWSVVGTGCLMLPSLVSAMSERMSERMLGIQVIAERPEPALVLTMIGSGAVDFATVLMPLIAVTAVAAIAGTGLQGGISPAWAQAKPKWERLNPVKGFKQRYSLVTLWEALKTLIKTLALGLVTWFAVRDLLPTVIAGGALPLSSSIDGFRAAAASLMQVCVILGVVLAAVDYVVQRRNIDKEIMMSHQEIKDEHKRSDGDPVMKQARRSRALAMSRNRMMSDIATADVVLVNPTHVAVALRYDPARGAPRVVAKGRGHLAKRIRELAAEHGVPMVADVPLARSLHDACAVGEEIPAALYGVVAEVLAFLVTIRRRDGRVGAPAEGRVAAAQPIRLPRPGVPGNR